MLKPPRICTECKFNINLLEPKLCPACELEYQERWAPLGATPKLFHGCRALELPGLYNLQEAISNGVVEQDRMEFRKWVTARVAPEVTLVGGELFVGVEPEATTNDSGGSLSIYVIAARAVRAAFGTTEYRCEWSVALTHAFYGISPSAAGYFESLANRFIPLLKTEMAIPNPRTNEYKFIATDLAYEWARFFQVGEQYEEAARLHEEQYPTALRPRSLQGYTRVGIAKNEVSRWHKEAIKNGRLLTNRSESVSVVKLLGTLAEQGVGIDQLEQGEWLQLESWQLNALPQILHAGFTSVTQYREWYPLIIEVSRAGREWRAVLQEVGVIMTKGTPIEWAHAYFDDNSIPVG